MMTSDLRVLIEKAQAGDINARNQIVTDHIGFIRHVVGRMGIDGHQRDDAVQVGVFAVIRAIAKFDFSQGTEFTTYAGVWIRGMVSRWVREDAIMHWPTPARVDHRIIKRLLDNEGDLTEDEIVERTGFDLKRVRLALSIPEFQSFDVSGADLGQEAWAPSADEDTEAEALERIEREAKIAAVHSAMLALGADDRELLTLRYGLFGTQEHTLNQIAARLHGNRESIRKRLLALEERLSIASELTEYREEAQ